MSDRLTAVLHTAAALLAEGGPDTLTMDRLAEDTGLSRATLYRLVGNREQLLARLGRDDTGDTRQRILAAARKVFAAVGLDGATVEGIAREAGVGAVTVYRQFGSKEGLITAFADEMAPRRAAREAAVPTDDPHADLLRVAHAALLALTEDADLLRVVLGEACRNSPFVPLLQHPTTRASETVTALLAAHMAAGRLRPEDPALSARTFVGMVFAHGLLGPLFDRAPPPDPAATAAHVVGIFLDGLGGSHGTR